ncbi:MAG: aspartate kinase [Sphingobacteriaceae bacterium]|nr:aspartate kinase [Sphingobacteriaceae bacterium]
MKVFKFGGASVKDAAGVMNLHRILSLFTGNSILVVVSAMGKTTNKLELVIQAWYTGNTPEAVEHIEELRFYHQELIRGLEMDLSQQEALLSSTDVFFNELREMVVKPTDAYYNQIYDQIVAYGELISTHIISGYLNAKQIANRWLDAREFIVTNDTFRDARINWSKTESNIVKLANNEGLIDGINVTQGFIGRVDGTKLTTTLGREGSDFTASIFAYCLGAKDVTIWKDVPGVLNADPKLFPFAEKIDELSYEEAVEMTYYGASVIHPKTIKPLQNKGIKLYVRSFLKPELEGTVIRQIDEWRSFPPCIIVKKNQMLISFASRDFSFVAEESLSLIFGELYKLGIKAHISQNSAISFRICVDEDPFKVQPFIEAVSSHFDVSTEGGLSLWTLRHQSEKLEKGLISGKTVLLEQRSKSAVQYVLR